MQGAAVAFARPVAQGGYGLGALQTAHVGAGGAADLGEAQGWSNAATLRYIVADPLTGRDDILAFGNAGVWVSMGQSDFRRYVESMTWGQSAFGAWFGAKEWPTSIRR